MAHPPHSPPAIRPSYPFLLTLIPEVEAARLFSRMVLSSRAAAIVGPLIWAWTADWLEPSFGAGIAYRSIVMTVAAGMSLLLLWKMPDRWKEQLVA